MAVTRGFVLGKFMPPHAGHMALCGAAERLVDTLTILVCWLPDDPIPGPLRLAWMRDLFPRARVVGHGAVVPQAPEDSADFWPIWRAIVAAAHPEPIDLLFAGEPYGARLAAEVGGRFVHVDRAGDAVSATAVRAAPWQWWEKLPLPVRGHFARTLCLHGPESVGKTRLAADLAAGFDTLWVPEYGRAHCAAHGNAFGLDDLSAIASTQSALIDAMKPWCNRRLVLDTDALMTAAWSLLTFGTIPTGLLDGPRADRYLLLDIDVPWTDDGTRLVGDPDRRRQFFDICTLVLERAGVRWQRVSGSWNERWETASAAMAVLTV